MFEKLKSYSILGATAFLTSPMFVRAEGDITGSNYIDGVLNTTQSQGDTLNTVSNTLKTFLGFIRGAGIIVCVMMLAWCAIQLAMSSGNQQKRQIAMEGIKNVLIAVAIIGSASLLAGLAYGILG